MIGSLEKPFGFSGSWFAISARYPATASSSNMRESAGSYAGTITCGARACERTPSLGDRARA